MSYAENTEVSAERSRNEIERTLSKYGASGFAYGWQGASAVVAFEMKERRIRFTVPLPPKSSKEFTLTPSGRDRKNPQDIERAWEQATRQKWRALALAIKAKLECVESGIATFEEEFMSHIVLPNGETVGAWMTPQIHSAYQNKKMPPLLGSGK